MIDIIYEDNHLIVCQKPPNIIVQEDSSGDIDMINILKKYLKQKYNKPGNVFVGLVHRLDRPVGGIMVFAKTSKGASRISEQIRNHEFKKSYLAVIKGTPEIKNDTIIDFLIKDEKTNTVRVVGENYPGAKKAILSYKIIVSNTEYSLLEINLITGRPHQIRVQFASRGFPLYGDNKYGENASNNNIGLWSYSIDFKHPTKEEIMNFKQAPPREEPWSKFNIGGIYA